MVLCERNIEKFVENPCGRAGAIVKEEYSEKLIETPKKHLYSDKHTCARILVSFREFLSCVQYLTGIVRAVCADSTPDLQELMTIFASAGCAQDLPCQ